MADISKITLPSGNTYDIKDATARQLIAGGIKFSVAWDGNSTPVVANIPAGVVVTYSGTDYVGTKTASSAELGTFYLVKTGTGTNKYDEYVVANGAWEKLGTQEVDLSGLGALAYLDKIEGYAEVASIPTGLSVSNSSSSVTFSGGTSDTFVKSYPGATSKLATTSITGTNGTDTATLVSSKVSKKLTTTSVPNVTNAGSASTWNFSMGTGNDAETLIISGANSTAPTLGTAITCATGALSDTSASSNVGGEVVSSFSTSDKTLAKAASSATTVATGSLAANGGGDSVMTGLGTATTASAVTGIGTGTAAAQTATTSYSGQKNVVVSLNSTYLDFDYFDE